MQENRSQRAGSVSSRRRQGRSHWELPLQCKKTDHSEPGASAPGDDKKAAHDCRALRGLTPTARGCKNQRQRQYNRVLTHAARRTSIDSLLLWKHSVLCWHAKHVLRPRLAVPPSPPPAEAGGSPVARIRVFSGTGAEAPAQDASRTAQADSAPPRTDVRGSSSLHVPRSPGPPRAEARGSPGTETLLQTSICELVKHGLAITDWLAGDPPAADRPGLGSLPGGRLLPRPLPPRPGKRA